ncbi:MAG: phage tail protein [Bacteroidales bacterium]|nr:phage tail protein [Bacteroidales bacterium]
MASPGMAIGSVIGYMVGGAAGASIGGMIGLWLDPPDPPDPPPLGDLGCNSYVRNYPVPIVYGQCKVYGGVIWIGDNSVEMENVGDKKNPSYSAMYYAEFCCALSEGEVKAFVKHFINDKTLDEIDDDDTMEIDITTYLGTSIQTINSNVLENLSGSDAPAIPWIYTAYAYVSGKIGTTNSLPTYSCELNGLLTETGEYDANPIKVVYDFLTNKRYGIGVSTDLIDGSPTTTGSWKTAADYCDVTVSDGNGGTEPRFRYSNSFTNRLKGYDLITDVLQTCRGFIYLSEGKLKIRIGNNSESPVLYFADSHKIDFTVNSNSTVSRIYADFSSYVDDYWIGDIGWITIGSVSYMFVVTDQTSTYIDLDENLSFAPNIGDSFFIKKENIAKGTFNYSYRSVRDRSNRIRVEFLNRDDSYRQDFVEIDDTFDINDTEEIREQTISMTGIKRKSQAARMACFFLDSSININYLCDFQTDILGYFLTVGDIIGITHARPAWAAKLFRVISLEEMENYEVKVSCIEYVPSVYHDNANPIIPTESFSVPNPYAKLDSTERLMVFEDSLNKKIMITFKRPDDNPYWIGALIYIQKGIGSDWEYLDRFNTISPSVKLSGAITNSDTVIGYDDSTLYDSFPSVGSFWLEDEEIYYSGIDDVACQFTGCIRGYNDTLPSSHLATQYCVLRQTYTPSYNYLDEEIGMTLSFKAYSVNIYNMQSDHSLAPSDSIVVNGLYYRPNRVSTLELNSQKSGTSLSASEDAVLTWRKTTDGINKGYGYIYGGGSGYGGGVLEGVESYVVRIYDQATESLLREYEITDTSTETYTYTSANNISDNGSYNEDLIFKIYQKNSWSIESLPATLITNL